MPTWTADDMAALIGDDVYSVSATYTPQGGAPAAKTIWFKNEYADISLASGDVMSAAPAAFGKASDFSGVKQGDALTVGGVNYTIINPKPDGTGMMTLILRKA